MSDKHEPQGRAATPSGVGGNNPLVLDEMSIPGATGPLPSGEWGINVAAARDNFPKNGLQVYIPAWPTMGRGDAVRVLLGNQQVAQTTINDDSQIDQRQVLFVPSEQLQNGSAELSYVVKRFGQTDELSLPTPIYVKLERPGGQDQNGSEPGHSELGFTLPEDVALDGVDKERAAKGVEVTIEPYPFMAENDEIRLSWGGIFVGHTVCADEVGAPIVIMVEEAVILEAGDSDALAVVFEVYDLVENRSEDWSAEQRVFVDTGNSRLDAAILKEAKNNVLDLEALGDADATLQVVAFDEPFVVGAFITANLRGETVDGETVDITYPDEEVESVPAVLEMPIPNADLRKLAKTQVRFSYELRTSDAALQQMDADALRLYEQARIAGEYRSKGQFVTIVGEAVRLAAPKALEAEQGALDPALPAVSVEVPWSDSFQAGDVITLVWEGEKPDTTPYYPSLAPHDISNGEAERQEPIRFVVDGQHLAAIDGGRLELFYEVARDGQAVRRSLRSPVYTVGEPRAELPAPTVAHADEHGVLDPENVPAAGTQLIVLKYPRIAVGDTLFFSWKGQDAEGSLDDSINITQANIDRDQFELTISKALVVASIGHEVVASYRVERADDSVSHSEPLTLYVGMPVPTIKTVVDAEGSEVPEQGSTYETAVTLTGEAMANERIVIVDGLTEGEPVTVGTGGEWTAQAEGLTVGSHALKAKALYGEEPESEVWTLTVLAHVVPSIDSVSDAYGAVPEDGVSFATEVTLEGKATPDRKVVLHDNAKPGQSLTADENGGWRGTLANLATGEHSIVAVAEYGEDLQSTPYTFNVETATKPVIEKVEDDDGKEVANGGQTHQTALTLSGSAYPGQQVQVMIDGAPGDTLTAVEGRWQVQVSGLSKAAHQFTTKALYGDEPISEPWRVTVVEVPELVIDTTTMVLDGHLYVYFDGLSLVRPENGGDRTSETRLATGGAEPLQYRSNDTTIAQVDSTTGLVRSYGDGETTITVEDSIGQTASFAVKVSNVLQFSMRAAMNFEGARTLQPLSLAESELIQVLFDFTPSEHERLGLWNETFWAWGLPSTPTSATFNFNLDDPRGSAPVATLLPVLQRGIHR